MGMFHVEHLQFKRQFMGRNEVVFKFKRIIQRPLITNRLSTPINRFRWEGVPRILSASVVRSRYHPKATLPALITEVLSSNRRSTPIFRFRFGGTG